MQTVAEADKLILKGKNELTRFRIMGDKYQDALSFFQPTINIYKYHKEWSKCAETIILCTECTDEEKAHRYHDIASCYKHFDESKYVEWTQKNIQQAAMEGNFSMMAHSYHELAEFYDKKKDSDNALKCYKHVISLQEIGKFTSAIHSVKQRMVELYIEFDNYPDALTLLQEILDFYSKTGTLKWHLDKILLTIMMIYICMDDEVMVKRMVVEYISAYPKFINSLEYALVENLVMSVTQKDLEGLEDCVKQYNELKELEPVQNALVSKIKMLIIKDEKEENDEPDLT